MSYLFSKRYNKVLAGVLLLFLPIGIFKSKQVIWAKLGLEGGSIDSRLHEYIPLLTLLCIAIILHACFRYFGRQPAIELLEAGLSLRSYYGFKKFIEWRNISAISVQIDEDSGDEYLIVDRKVGEQYRYKLSPVDCDLSELQENLSKHIKP